MECRTLVRPGQYLKSIQKMGGSGSRKYIVLRPEALIAATALWTMTAWAHEGATHSPILVSTMQIITKSPPDARAKSPSPSKR